VHDRAQEIGLFRYRLARELAEDCLSGRERGRLARELAAREHLGPDGWVRVSRTTLDRWTRAYRAGGFAALVPVARRVDDKTPAWLIELACALRAEQPARTAAQIARIIVEVEGSAPSARTIARHLAAAGLPWKGGALPARALGRFEADRPNELWTGDALHGPVIAGHKTYLFCFLDDHSRLFCGYRWAAREDVLSASRALRAGLAARGRPAACYVDNGSPFVSSQLLRACAILDIRLFHSRPRRPEGRGKVERAFRTVREQFLRECQHRPPASVDELNRAFQAWVETVYHARVHSETGQTPLERFLAAGAPRLMSERQLAEAFLWSERRRVSKTATFGMHANVYEVDPELAGRRVELVFDPLDLSEVQVRLDGRPAGRAIPRQIKRHVHPRAQPGPQPPPAATGIDYLGLIQARRARELQARIDYRNLPTPEDRRTASDGPDDDKELI